jgi:hypothetical protein
MAPELTGGETVLTGMLEDQSAVFGILARIEAIGLELLELRRDASQPGPARLARTPGIADRGVHGEHRDLYGTSSSSTAGYTGAASVTTSLGAP